MGRRARPRARAGNFGENLTTEGLDVTGAIIGERWRIGSDGVLLEVSAPRIPCRTFQGFLDVPHWSSASPTTAPRAPTCGVLREGTVGAGDADRGRRTAPSTASRSAIFS